jgi:hypothetical protein
MEQFPEDRRRNLGTANIDPLLKRLQAKDQELQEALELVPRLRDRMVQLEQRPDKPTVIKSLTDEELRFHLGERFVSALGDDDILRLFKQPVLNLLTPEDIVSSCESDDLLACIPMSTLVGYAATRILEQIESGVSSLQEMLIALSALSDLGKQHAVTPIHKSVSPVIGEQRKPLVKKLRVVILGMKPNQTQIVSSHINGQAEIVFAPKDMKANAIKNMTADVFILWGSFCSHQDQVHVKARAKQLGSKFVIYHGGMANFMRRIDEELGLAAA